MNKTMHPLIASILGDNPITMCIKNESCNDFFKDLQLNMSNPSLMTEQGRLEAHKQAMMSTFGGSGYTGDGLYVRYNKMAIIPVHGSLVNRFNSCLGFVTGYGFIKSAIANAMNDESVETIVLDINSTGGEAAGCFETAAFIKEAAAIKPIHAVVDSRCYSAAYAIASACTSITCTPSSGAGSIGVVAMHVSWEKALDDAGYKVTFIQAGAKKTMGNPFQDLSEEVKAELQKGIDKLYDSFVELVVENRSIDKDLVIKTEAACYTSNEALEMGLIDGVATIEQAIINLEKEDEMSGTQPTASTADVTPVATAVDTTTPVATAPAAASTADVTPVATAVDTTTPVATAPAAATTEMNAAEQERARIKGITTCEAAQGRTKLAQHLAYETNMSVDEASAILNASGLEAGAAKSESTEESNQESMLDKAMALVGTPNVGADGAKTNASDSELAAQFANSINI